MPQMSDEKISFTFENQRCFALPGQSIAAALFSNGIKTLRLSPARQQPRGMFCLMGSCQECLVMVNGKRALACKTEASSDLEVTCVSVTEQHEPF